MDRRQSRLKILSLTDTGAVVSGSDWKCVCARGERDVPMGRPMTRRWRRSLVVTFVVLALFGPAAVELYTDWLWFGETGYQTTFLRVFTARITLGLAATAFVFAVLLVSMRFAMRGFSPRQLVVTTRDGPVSVTFDSGLARSATVVVAGVLALGFGLYASSRWLDLLMLQHAQHFGDADPVLGRDAGFYVFQLPFLAALSGFLLMLVVVTGLTTAATYVLTRSLDYSPLRGVQIAASAKRHLAVLAAALLLVLALGAYLDVPRLLHEPGGIIHGATNVDVAVRMPALRALIVAALVAAGLALYQAFSRSWWPIRAAGALYVAVAIGGAVAATVMQRFVVAPNELARETPYIEHNISGTRKAFALDRVEERQLSGDALLTRADIEANDATLRNVRLWDHQPLLQTFAQIQEIRTYYDFASVHNDRYPIDGEYRQIMLSARELNSDSLPNRTWINERLTFTHGYGVTLGPVNQVTPEGLPVLFIKDLPPRSSVDLHVQQPAIYFGQLSNDHVFVGTKAREFHYPQGDDNVYAAYEGTGGVPIDNAIRRLLFAARFKSFKLLLSDDITNESRVMFHRRVSDRVRRIAPFLQYEPEPYLLIASGRLFWLQDAYTTSTRYPYATPAAGGTNYIRNSIKVTVDAYDGTTTFYVIDETDPIARALTSIFPDLFRPLAEMPADMRTRLRYPQGIFKLQAAMFSTYHMNNPAVFYNKEDQWEIPSIESEPRPEPMQPYYTIMKLPGERAAEFIQMLPFTPARKDNLASWMVARSDGAHYGRMLVFQFPKQKVVFGPRQIVGRISQDQAIAPQITLWNQQGSEVLQGTLLVIPIEESLVYVRPLYLRAAGGRIPELKRVIVAHQNQIVMEESLEKALDRLFPVGGSDRRQERVASREQERVAAPEIDAPSDRPQPENDALTAQALEHYRNAIQAQRDGNWARYGDEIRRLGDVLEKMRRQ
jgi:uncharacterized protein